MLLRCKKYKTYIQSKEGSHYLKAYTQDLVHANADSESQDAREGELVIV